MTSPSTMTTTQRPQRPRKSVHLCFGPLWSIPSWVCQLDQMFQQPAPRRHRRLPSGTMVSYAEVKSYLSKREIPQLFESLMAGLMYHRPENHIGYLQSCLDDVKSNSETKVQWSTFVNAKKRKSKEILPPLTPKKQDSFSSSWSDNSRQSTPLPPISARTRTRDSMEQDFRNTYILYHNPPPVLAKPRVPVVSVLGGLGTKIDELCERVVSRLRGVVHISTCSMLKTRMTIEGFYRMTAVPACAVVDSVLQAMSMVQSANALLVAGFPRSRGDIEEYRSRRVRMDGVVLVDFEEEALRRFLENEVTSGIVRTSEIEAELERFKQDIISVAEYYDSNELLTVVMGDQDLEEIIDDLVFAIDKIIETRKNIPDEDTMDIRKDQECDSPCKALLPSPDRLERPSTVEIRDATEEDIKSIEEEAMRVKDDEVEDTLSKSEKEMKDGQDTKDIAKNINTEKESDEVRVYVGTEEERSTEATDKEDRDIGIESEINESNPITNGTDKSNKEAGMEEEEIAGNSKSEKDGESSKLENMEVGEEENSTENTALEREIKNNESEKENNLQEDSKSKDSIVENRTDSENNNEINELKVNENESEKSEDKEKSLNVSEIQPESNELINLANNNGANDPSNINDSDQNQEIKIKDDVSITDKDNIENKEINITSPTIPIIFSFGNVNADYDELKNLVANDLEMCFIDFQELMRNDGSNDDKFNNDEALQILRGILKQDSISYSNGFFIFNFSFSLLNKNVVEELQKLGELSFVCNVRENRPDSKSEEYQEEKLFQSSISENAKIIFVTEENVILELRQSLQEIIDVINSKEQKLSDDMKPIKENTMNDNETELSQMPDERNLIKTAETVSQIERNPPVAVSKEEASQNATGDNNIELSGMSSGSDLIENISQVGLNPPIEKTAENENDNRGSAEENINIKNEENNLKNNDEIITDERTNKDENEDSTGKDVEDLKSDDTLNEIAKSSGSLKSDENQEEIPVDAEVDNTRSEVSTLASAAEETQKERAVLSRQSGIEVETDNLSQQSDNEMTNKARLIRQTTYSADEEAENKESTGAEDKANKESTKDEVENVDNKESTEDKIKDVENEESIKDEIEKVRNEESETDKVADVGNKESTSDKDEEIKNEKSTKDGIEKVESQESITDKTEDIGNKESTNDKIEDVGNREATSDKAEDMANKENSSDKAEDVENKESRTNKTEDVANKESINDKTEGVGNGEITKDEIEKVENEKRTDKAEDVGNKENTNDKTEDIGNKESTNGKTEGVGNEESKDEIEKVGNDESRTDEAEDVGNEENTNNKTEDVGNKESTKDEIEKAGNEESRTDKAEDVENKESTNDTAENIGNKESTRDKIEDVRNEDSTKDKAEDMGTDNSKDEISKMGNEEDRIGKADESKVNETDEPVDSQPTERELLNNSGEEDGTKDKDLITDENQIAYTADEEKVESKSSDLNSRADNKGNMTVDEFQSQIESSDQELKNPENSNKTKDENEPNQTSQKDGISESAENKVPTSEIKNISNAETVDASEILNSENSNKETQSKSFKNNDEKDATIVPNNSDENRKPASEEIDSNATTGENPSESSVKENTTTENASENKLIEKENNIDIKNPEEFKITNKIPENIDIDEKQKPELKNDDIEDVTSEINNENNTNISQESEGIKSDTIKEKSLQNNKSTAERQKENEERSETDASDIKSNNENVPNTKEVLSSKIDNAEQDQRVRDNDSDSNDENITIETRAEVHATENQSPAPATELKNKDKTEMRTAREEDPENSQVENSVPQNETTEDLLMENTDESLALTINNMENERYSGKRQERNGSGILDESKEDQRESEEPQERSSSSSRGEL